MNHVKIIFLSASIIFSCINLGAKTLQLPASHSQISILTCSPGPDLYSLFGHTAIRVLDTTQQSFTDVVFNYGTFDFDTENFYVKFAMGKLPYKLSVADFGSFQYQYIQEGRGIIEQILLLTDEEKHELIMLLAENSQPENCFYKYDFFYDNCSTRVRDIIAKALQRKGQNLNFNYNYQHKYTFRQAIQRYLDYQPWSDFGIDLALGLPCDRTIDTQQFMFLPDSLMNEFANAVTGSRLVVKSPSELLPKDFELKQKTLFTPLLVFSLFLLIHVTTGLFVAWKWANCFQFTDRLLFFATGITGLLLVFLWFLTDHTATAYNFNLLWANPLLLLFAFRKKKILSGWKKYFIAAFLLIVMLTLATWLMLPQRLHLATIPIMTALVFTSWKMLRPYTFTKVKA